MLSPHTRCAVLCRVVEGQEAGAEEGDPLAAFRRRLAHLGAIGASGGSVEDTEMGEGGAAGGGPEDTLAGLFPFDEMMGLDVDHVLDEDNDDEDGDNHDVGEDEDEEHEYDEEDWEAAGRQGDGDQAGS